MGMVFTKALPPRWCLSAVAAFAAVAAPAAGMTIVERAVSPATGTATFLVETEGRFERSAFVGGLEQPVAVVCVKDPGPCEQAVQAARAALAPTPAPLASLHLESSVDAGDRRREQPVAATTTRPALTLRVTTRTSAPPGVRPVGSSPAAAANTLVDVIVEAMKADAVVGAVMLPGLSSASDPWSADASLWCDAGRCMVALTADLGVDARGLDAAVSSSFDVTAPPVVVPATACAGRPVVSVTANPGLVSTRGAAVADALRRAGCVVADVTAAKRAREQTAVYGRAGVAAAAAVGTALGAAVEPLTWQTTAAVVVAVGER